MLVQFTVENYLSIKDKVFLSLEPSKDSEHPENIISQGDNKAVTSAVIYGANASGKSSLFKAIATALTMIKNSNNVQITDKLPVVPFKFDIESRNKASSFEFTFVAKDEKKYVYGFSTTVKEIIEEYLYRYDSAKPTLIFDLKEDDEPKYNRAYKTKLEAAYQMNTANKLFLATATMWNVECTKVPFEWLVDYIDTFTEVMDLSDVALDKYRIDDKHQYIDFIKNLLKQADINISNIEVETKDAIVGKSYDIEVITGHTIEDEEGNITEYPLTLQEESMGTQLLFFYGPLLKDAFEKGKALILDEIDKSMHPSLVKFIINLFRDPDVNKAGAQLIVTTHETGILTLDMFRRDQIYFTEKDSKTGVTDLYSLDEFSVRKTENIEKGYLMGRYGAIPFLKNEELL
jgi:AAA15 family ATPase/GTPase